MRVTPIIKLIVTAYFSPQLHGTGSILCPIIADNLQAGTIAQAVKQINNTVFLRSLDESATKQSVVLRLLSLCGWNQFDLSEVAPEYTVGNRRVDYALYAVPGA